MPALSRAAASVVLVCAAAVAGPPAPPVSRPPQRVVPRPPVRVPPEGEIVLMLLAKPELGPAGYEIFTMNLDGSGRRQITDDETQEFLPHFAPPDGSRLLFTRFVSGVYGDPDAETHLVTYDFATRTETDLGEGYPGVWSPDGARIAFLARDGSLRVMDADGTHAHEVGRPRGDDADRQWGDLAWSSDDWILFVVSETCGTTFKVRMDRIRPDGSGRTKVSDGGMSCTPPGLEQSGDADPGFGPDGRVVYTSRGFARSPSGQGPPAAERRLVALSADAWFPGKPEHDLSLPAFPSCVEGVPKASPDGGHVLLFRHCVAQGVSGIAVTDANGSYRRFVTDGFGPDWHPLARSRADVEADATWRTLPASAARLSAVEPRDAALDARLLDAADGLSVVLPGRLVNGSPLAAFDATWTVPPPPALLAFRVRLRGTAAAAGSVATLAVLAEDPATGAFERILGRSLAPGEPADLEIELGNLRYVADGALRVRVLATAPPAASPVTLAVDFLGLEVLAREDPARAR